jgi:phosphatidylcholine synthase
VIVVLALLTFVPSRYLYPTQRGRLNRIALALCVPWVGLLAAVLWAMPGGRLMRPLLLLSLYFPAYYLIASWVVTIRSWRGRSLP